MSNLKFKRLTLEEAKALAEKWIKKLNGCCCLKTDVVAGVYKGKKETSDVDLICLVKDRKSLSKLNPIKEDSIRTVFDDTGAKIEIWRVNKLEDYILTRWYRRKTRHEFIRLASIAKSRGMKLSWKKGLLDQHGNIISKDPNKIEEILSST